jgi:hypothetical protein
MMLFEPLGSITEFLRTTSFLEAEVISGISPTLGRALEFLQKPRRVIVITID